MKYATNRKADLDTSEEEVRPYSRREIDAFAAVSATAPSTADQTAANLALLYVDSLRLVERLHRHLLDVIKDEFERTHAYEISSVCALLLFNIGKETITASAIQTRSYYLGSNVSYNLKKLVEGSYLHRARGPDRRSVLVGLTEKGMEIAAVVDRLYDRQVRRLAEVDVMTVEDFHKVGRSLQRLERFLSDQVSYRL